MAHFPEWRGITLNFLRATKREANTYISLFIPYGETNGCILTIASFRMGRKREFDERPWRVSFAQGMREFDLAQKNYQFICFLSLILVKLNDAQYFL